MNLDACRINTYKFGANVNNISLLKSSENSLKNTIFTPSIESCIDGMPIAKFFGQGSPFATVFDSIKHGIQEIDHFDFFGLPLCWEYVLDKLKVLWF